MIQINLSEEQAKELLRAFCWRSIHGSQAIANIKEEVAKTVFMQLEHKFLPRNFEQAEFAKWKGDNGVNDRIIESWRRQNETAEESGL